MTLILQCSESKLDHPAAARDIYNSQLFRCQKLYAEQSNLPWLIFSAKYGLVEPSTILEPYDVTMGMPGAISDRELTLQLPSGTLYSLCGSGYNKRLEKLGADVVWVLRGLNVGERKGWLINNKGKPL